MKYYAVAKGRKTGIFTTWDECKTQVIGFSGAKFKSFQTREEAEKFIGNGKKKYAVINNTDFDADSIKDEEKVFAYVDGSYVPGFYGSGIIMINLDGEEVSTLSCKGSEPPYLEMNNVGGEVNASMIAVKSAISMGYKLIRIHYDYAGIECWATGEWKRNKEGTKAYKKFIDENSKDIIIEFKKVKAHAGNKYNEIADDLAKQAVGIY